jgi:hypothetical protein
MGFCLSLLFQNHSQQQPYFVCRSCGLTPRIAWDASMVSRRRLLLEIDCFALYDVSVVSAASHQDKYSRNSYDPGLEVENLWYGAFEREPRWVLKDLLRPLIFLSHFTSLPCEETKMAFMTTYVRFRLSVTKSRKGILDVRAYLCGTTNMKENTHA